MAHGWYLGFQNKALFSNPVQAWKYGTVIPELYHVIKRFGRNPVDEETLKLYSENEISPADQEFLKVIWDQYKDFNGLELSQKTHESDTPWTRIYKEGLPNTVIPNDVIKNYYDQLIEEKRG